MEGAWLNFRYRVFYPYLREGLTDVEHSNQELKEVREEAMLISGRRDIQKAGAAGAKDGRMLA